MMKMVDADESGTVDLDEFTKGLTTTCIAMACPDTESGGWMKKAHQI